MNRRMFLKTASAAPAAGAVSLAAPAGNSVTYHQDCTAQSAAYVDDHYVLQPVP